MEIQSVLFDKYVWTPSAARQWLKKHNLKPLKMVHKTKNELRYRINEPYLYSEFFSKKIRDGDIILVLGKP